ETGGEVAGVEEGDADARLGGGRDQGLAHGVGVGVGGAAGGVVQVVELADGGDAGEGHLGVHGAGEAVVGVGGQPVGDRVHDLPPGPEGAAADLDGAAQGAVEGVRVGVRQPEIGRAHV